MGRSWREEVVLFVFYQAQESLYSIGLKIIQASRDKP